MKRKKYTHQQLPKNIIVCGHYYNKHVLRLLVNITLKAFRKYFCKSIFQTELVEKSQAIFL